MALITAYNTGTASVANGSKAVTGSGTAWFDIGLTAGDVLWNVDGTASQRIDTVTDNTHMTLVNNWGGTSLSGAAYEIRVTPPSASIAATVRALLELLSNGVLSGLAALTATTGNVIQSVSGAWASVSPAVMMKALLTTDGDVPLNSSGTVIRAPIATAIAKILTTAGDWLYNDSGTVVRKTSAQAAAIMASSFANDAISGNAVDGGTISNFASTGIADGATANLLTLTSVGRVVVGSGTGNALMSVQGQTAGAIFTTNDGTTFATITKSVNGLATGENAAACVHVVRKDSTTGRSINSAGTNNASGADYADYYFKRSDCATVSKGQGVGFDADGLITDKWVNAVSFGVKSTAPSVVGGDIWGSPDALGMDEPVPPLEPAEPVDDGRISYDDLQTALAAYPALMNEYDAAATKYDADKATFETALETQRQKVDRIAVAGKVPAIVSGTLTAGDWIIPVQDGDSIKLIAIADADVSFPQYRLRVGRVLIANPTEAQFRSLIDGVDIVPEWTAIIDVVKG